MKRTLWGRIRLLAFFIGALILLTETPMALADTINPRMKLMAHRAAKMDAYRNLLEFVYGLRVDAGTTVRDFIASDLVQSRLSAGIRGARELDYVAHPDGTAEVTVEIELGTLETILGTRIQYEHEIIEATGYGAPPGMPTGGHAPSSAAMVQATGYGIEPNEPGLTLPEKDLLGMRAAKVDALRNLVEEIDGVQITAESTVRDFAVQNDDIRTRVNALVNGAKVVSEKKLPDGRYEVKVETDIEPIKEIIGIR